MTKFAIHGGDFITGATPPSFSGGYFTLCSTAHRWRGETIAASEVVAVEVLSQVEVSRLAGTLGWGAAGSVTLGPIGALVGMLLGGRGTNVTFSCRFADGRKLVATVDAKTFAGIRAAMAAAPPRRSRPASTAGQIEQYEIEKSIRRGRRKHGLS